MTDSSVVWVARHMTDRKCPEEALRLANDALKKNVAELENNSRDASLLGAMSELLQSCVTMDEFRNVVAHFVPRMFPDAAGRGYSPAPARARAGSGASRGGPPPPPPPPPPCACSAPPTAPRPRNSSPSP